VDLTTLSQLLWYTYGLIDGKRRVVPSAGATYPVEVYVVVKNVSWPGTRDLQVQ